MNRAVFKIIGTAPLLYAQPVFDEKRDDETHSQLEERTWRKKAVVDDNGHLAVKSVAVQRSLLSAGSWLSLKLTKNKTYTKRFESGVTSDQAYFPVHNGKKVLTVDDVDRLDLYVPSDGKRGGQKRVWRSYPTLKPGWWIDGSLIVLDEAISEDVFRKHLETAGLYDGIGSMRVGRGGSNGRFVVDKLKFEPFEF